MVKKNRFASLITMETWMFLGSIEKLRIKTLENATIASLVHMPYLGKGGTSLGINFGTAAYVLSKHHIAGYLAEYNYIRYYECNNEGIPEKFPLYNERHCFTSQSVYKRIPSSPIAYWVSNELSCVFEHKRIATKSISDGQTKTGDNNRFLKMLWEVPANQIGKTRNGLSLQRGAISAGGMEILNTLLIGLNLQDNIIGVIMLPELHLSIYGLEKAFHGIMLQVLKDLQHDICQTICYLKPLPHLYF